MQPKESRPEPAAKPVAKPIATSSSSSSSSLRSSAKSFLSGGVGGVCAVLVGHPFDLIKVRMQTGMVSAGSGSGASVFGALAATLRAEGPRGLYRGVSAPLVASTPIYAMSFWGYDVGQRIVRSVGAGDGASAESERPLTLPEIMVAGGLSALPMLLVMTPTERIKCLLQVQTAEGKDANANANAKGGAAKPQQRYTGMVDCATKLYRTGGLRSLYKGMALTMARDVPGSVAWFGTYEVVKRFLSSLLTDSGSGEAKPLSPVAVMVAGGFAGMACWGTTIVPDNLKSRYQAAPEGAYRGGALEVYQTLVRNEGYGALWTGFRPAMIRAFPANAACFLGMEVAKKAFAFLD